MTDHPDLAINTMHVTSIVMLTTNFIYNNKPKTFFIVNNNNFLLCLSLAILKGESVKSEGERKFFYGYARYFKHLTFISSVG
jgi:hypothetical protein